VDGSPEANENFQEQLLIEDLNNSEVADHRYDSNSIVKHEVDKMIVQLRSFFQSQEEAFRIQNTMEAYFSNS